MATLRIPMSIWLSLTTAERDSQFLSAGFDPALDVASEASADGTVLIFQQGVPSLPSFETPVPQVAFVPDQGVFHEGGPPFNYIPHPDEHPRHASRGLLDWQAAQVQAGDRLTDAEAESYLSSGTANPQNVSFAGLTGDNPVTDEFGQPVAAVGITVAGRALRLILGGGGGRLTAAIWQSLPSIVRSALVQVGIGVGALIAFNGDIPFITLPGQGTDIQPSVGPGLPAHTNGHVDIQIQNAAHPFAYHHLIVGSWNTNPKNPAEGVTFYRLSNGKLAVQNKKGRWKVWRPKRPIVLYRTGAVDLKTLIEADEVLNKQAKKLAKVLNRRAPRPKTSKKDSNPAIIVQGSGKVIDT